jgi:hypothetical protein
LSNFNISGVTGHRVVVDTDGDPYMPGAYVKVYIDRIPQNILRISRARDGGTTTIDLANGGQIVYPRKIGEKDRRPRYNGEVVHE